MDGGKLRFEKLALSNTANILVNKRNDRKIFFKYIFLLKPKQLFIIIYVNVRMKRVCPHKTNNNILFRNGKILECQFSVQWW
jgi:hypothetical protein